MAENEVLKIFNERYRPIGIATRKEAHTKGFWHETFHCWFYTIENDELIVYFQKRAATKKDFPNQLDITAAGHLLANETIMDGFREVEEELGVTVTEEEATLLGVFPVQIKIGHFIDNEFTNVFLVERKMKQGDFTLQEEEVESLFPIPLSTFKKLFADPNFATTLEGYRQEKNEQKVVQECFSKKDFCANAESYYDQLITSFEKILEKQTRTID